MKNKIFILAFVVATFFSSCSDVFNLDLKDNPNAPAADEGNVNAVYNQIQLDFADIHYILEDQTGEVTRMYQALAFNYGNATLPSAFDNLWTIVYADFMQDVDALETLAKPAGLNVHIGSAKILKAIVLMEMVDVFGNIPYSEIGQGLGNLSPKVDNGADVYGVATSLLDEAITVLGNPGDDKPAFDNFYGGNAASWITLANTMKLRAAYLKGDATAFNAVIEAGDYIDEASEDFQFNYGSNRVNPDSRHPRYVNQYEASDGDYMSNYYMWLLRGDKLDVDGETELRDPRLRYYFYRKVSNSNKQPTDSYGCHIAASPDQSKKPAEYGRVPFCYAATDGYTGRDHLNGSGIPADGYIRTAYGLYPAGGDFDANDFKNIQNKGTDGGGGQGILPIMLSSFVDFMRAHMALSSSTADAKTLLLSGVSESLNKVKGFEALVSDKLGTNIKVLGTQTTVGDAFAMTEDDMTAYENLVGRLFDEATTDNGRLDVIIKEYYIAAFGNGLEAYNIYRKTGLPANMVPPLQPETSGDFPRSMRYANAFVDRNSAVEQKKESDLVFWDDGSTTLK